MAYEKLKQEHYRNLGGVNTHESTYQTGDTKFLDLRNFCFERPGALSSRPGIEYHLTLNSVSYAIKPYTTAQFVQSSGSFLVFDSGDRLFSYAGSYSLIGQSIVSSGHTYAIADTETTRNVLYWANGDKFLRFNGSYLDIYDVGQVTGQPVSLGVTFNVSLITGPTAIIASGTWSIHYQLARGYTALTEGPYYPVQYASTKSSLGVTVSPLAGVGIAATILSRGRWVVTMEPGGIVSSTGVTPLVPGQTMGVLPFLVKNTAGITNFASGTAAALYYTTISGTTFLHYEFDHISFDTDQDLSKIGFGTSAGPYYPNVISNFNNMLFAAGGNIARDTVWHSEPGEPENIQPENFFLTKWRELDDINGMAVFQDALIIFKTRSVWELTGNEPSNFQLRQLTVDYGLVNNRALVVFENLLWFVDKTGIIEYDGSNFKRVSEPVASFLDAMDKTTIFGVHVKKKRQVQFWSSSTGLVYDYLTEGWLIYDGAAIDSNAGPVYVSYGATRSDLSWWKTGSSFHELSRFNDSLSTDYGIAITLIAQTRFHKRLEQTTQELWRRAYVNMDVPGSTQGVTLQLIHNYGASVYAERSIYADTFQKRVEFGISARSLSVKFIIQSSQPIKLNGYALESRFLRKV